MFNTIECDSSQMEGLDMAGINHHNMMLYMDLLDHKLFNLITNKAFLDFKVGLSSALCGKHPSTTLYVSL